MSDYTPGPWFTGCHTKPQHNCQCRHILSEASYPGAICEVSVSNGKGKRLSSGWNGDPPENQAIANAHLIAAAPELYEALEISTNTLLHLQNALKETGFDIKEIIDISQKALAKARGDQ